MIRRILSVLAIIFAIAAIVGPLRAQDSGDEVRRSREAATVLDEIMGAGDKGIPATVLEKAEGIVVFPGLLKGGLGVGAQRGRGILSVRSASVRCSARR